jgi:hypothetical protein
MLYVKQANDELIGCISMANIIKIGTNNMTEQLIICNFRAFASLISV